MSSASFLKPGKRFLRDNLFCEIAHTDSEEVFLKYENCEIESQVVPIRQLISEYGKTLISLSHGTRAKRVPEHASTPQKREIARREKYIKEAQRRTKGNAGVGGVTHRLEAINLVKDQINDKTPPSPATLARWIKDSNNHSMGIAGTLLTKPLHLYQTQYEALKQTALEVIIRYYLKLSRPKMKAVYDIFKKRVQDLGVYKIPCFGTFRGWIRDIIDYDAIKKREGVISARETHRLAISEILTSHPLERVEVDGLRLAIGIVDEDNNYLGTPVLIIVLDCHTRCVLGYSMHIGTGEPSSAYINAYKHAIFPKEDDSYYSEKGNDWPFLGTWEKIVVDGGPGAISKESMSFLLQAGIDINIAQIRAGWKKPFIERFNGTVRTSFAEHISSYCGHSKTFTSDNLLRKKAHLTLDQFRNLFEAWLLDDYHQSGHSELDGATPYECWQREVNKDSFDIELPANYKYLMLAQGETKYAKVLGNHCGAGVQINNIKYNDSEGKLQKIGFRLRGENKPATVECRYSTSNIYSIIVIDERTGEHIEALAYKPSFVVDNMSLTEFNAKRSTQPVIKNRAFIDSKILDKSEQEFNENNKSSKGKKARKVDIPGMNEEVSNRFNADKKAEQDLNNNTSLKQDVTDSTDDVDIEHKLTGFDYD